MRFYFLDSWRDTYTDQLMVLYKDWWWTKERTRADVETMIQHSDLLFGLCEQGSGNLIGFTRVLTDRIYKATLYDVIIAKEHQKQGLGRVLLDAVLNHPALAKVAHIELYCLDELVPFYERFGFTEDLAGLRLMRIVEV